MIKITQFIRLLRPQQWLKNMFVFLPLFFDGHAFDMAYVLPSFYVFVAFSLTASGVYCFNDIYDVEADRLHAVKRLRPIASGAVSRKEGYLLMLLCWAASLVVVNLLTWPSGEEGKNEVLGIIIFYVLMNIAYCVRLKNIAIIDVFIISVGFVLRVLSGGFATGIFMSHWIILMTFLLALFLAFAKRRDDVVIYEETGVKARRNVNRYNLAFMNQAIGIVASITMVCYIMYTVSPEVVERYHSSYVYITSIFVLAGIIRYLQITIVDVKSGSPTRVLFKDKFVQICIMGWILLFCFIIYF